MTKKKLAEYVWELIDKSGVELKVISDESGVSYQTILKLKKNKKAKSDVLDNLLDYLKKEALIIDEGKDLKMYLKDQFSKAIEKSDIP